MSLNRMSRRYDRFLGPDVAADVRDELRFHIDAKVHDLIAQGWTEEAARKEAARQFGNLRSTQREGERIGDSI
jgi:putative ABC transport system permease protein